MSFLQDWISSCSSGLVLALEKELLDAGEMAQVGKVSASQA